MLKVINVHAGHNPDGKIACGAVGILKESTQARLVKNEVIRQLIGLGYSVNDCTCDDGVNKDDVLNKIISKCNATKADLDVSIHFNSAAKDYTGDGRTTGTEVYIYSKTAGAYSYAEKVTKEIEKLGFRNRGVKAKHDLRVLRETKAPAMLVECCFVDDADDVKLYDPLTMAGAIVKGITGQTYVETKNDDLYRVQVGAFAKKENAEKLLADLKRSGYNGFITK